MAVRAAAAVQTRNSQRQAAAADVGADAGAAGQEPAPPSDAPASRPAGGDQSQQGQGQRSEQQQQQQREQAQQHGQQQGEAGSAPAELAELVQVVTSMKEQLAGLTGDQLILSETTTRLHTNVAQLLRQQQQQGSPQPAQRSLQRYASGDAGDASASMSDMQAVVNQLDRRVGEVCSLAGNLLRILTAAGLSGESEAEELQVALSKGSQAYVEQQQLRTEFQAQQQRISQLEERMREQESRMSSVRAGMGQLQQRAGLEGSQVEFVAWAPSEWTADEVLGEVASAAGVSSKVIISAERKYTPQPARGGEGNAAGAAAGAPAGSAGGGAPGSSGGSGPEAGSSSGGGGSAGGSGQPQRQQQQRQQRGSRQQLSLYVLRLSHERYLPACLGGKCRMTLRGRQLPVYVDRALTEGERAERRRLAPVARQLRVEGVRVRWQGPVLEQQVERAGGRKQWRVVDPLPPAVAPASAEQAAGGGADGGQ